MKRSMMILSGLLAFAALVPAPLMAMSQGQPVLKVESRPYACPVPSAFVPGEVVIDLPVSSSSLRQGEYKSVAFGAVGRTARITSNAAAFPPRATAAELTSPAAYSAGADQIKPGDNSPGALALVAAGERRETAKWQLVKAYHSLSWERWSPCLSAAAWQNLRANEAVARSAASVAASEWQTAYYLYHINSAGATR